MVESGLVPIGEKCGNDEADKAADKGAMKEDVRLSCLAEKYSHKRRMYGDFMIRIQKYIIRHGKVEKTDEGQREQQEQPL